LDILSQCVWKLHIKSRIVFQRKVFFPSFSFFLFDQHRFRFENPMEEYIQRGSFLNVNCIMLTISERLEQELEFAHSIVTDSFSLLPRFLGTSGHRQMVNTKVGIDFKASN